MRVAGSAGGTTIVTRSKALMRIVCHGNYEMLARFVPGEGAEVCLPQDGQSL